MTDHKKTMTGNCNTMKMTDQIAVLEIARPGKWRTSHNLNLDTMHVSTRRCQQQTQTDYCQSDLATMVRRPQRLVASPASCLNPTVSVSDAYSDQYGEQDAMLSQEEPRDATISFDTTASCMRLLWHSMGFLYRPTSATVQMLKLHHTVRW